MNVCDMKRGEHAVVLKVELDTPERERLRALNIHVGAPIELLKVSLFKKTYLLQAKSAKVALGREVAAGIRIWKTK